KALATYIRNETIPAENLSAQVLTQIMELGEKLGGLELENGERDEIIDRLRNILQRFQGTAADNTINNFDAAGDDELFEFIDRSRHARSGSKVN
ncbi:hypothetical protein, partial [Mycobacterium paragordonae]|uniref:hypothetical protein n=2 Tax=Mycobacterium TaxID=1763 RepID=UPI0039865C43